MNVTRYQPTYPHAASMGIRGDAMNPLELLVQARLEDIQADVRAAQARRSVARQGAPPGSWRDRSRALRVRIGHVLVSFGAAVAGEERPAPDQRAA
jgi:hypothetical protein